MSQERLVSGDCSQAYTAVPLTLHPKPDLLVLIKRILKSHISLVNLCIHALEKPAREARTYVGTGRTCKRLTKATNHPVNSKPGLSCCEGCDRVNTYNTS